MPRHPPFSNLAAILVLLFSATPACAAGGISLANAWVAEAPPGSTVAAGYLDINNTRSEAATLVEVSSTVFSHVAIHQSQLSDGVASMKQLETLVIPGQSTVSLCPGALHLMLFAPRQPLSKGDLVALTFIFADGLKLALAIPVKSEQPRACGH